MTALPATLPVWHEGERFIQNKLGVADRMAAVGPGMIRDHMPDQHRAFYAQLPFIVVGSVDATDAAWATLVEGRPGFITSPDPVTLHIAAAVPPGDPAAQGLRPGGAVGLLGIEMHTRRRNRMNGFVATAPHGFVVRVDQSFGNCPRYIQLRDVDFARDPAVPHHGAVETLSALDAAARRQIADADNFFVASYTDREDRRQVDVSHRGGKAGFVRVDEDGTLTIPDFNGNLYFNTLGNIVLNGRAGLLFVDYQTGDVLQMTGTAEVIFDSPEIAAFQGAERLWTFRAQAIVRRRGALALRGTMPPAAWSPGVLMTGSWDDAASRLRAAELANRWRPFVVTRIVEESSAIRSLHLRPDDGAGLLPHLAGQHLPIRVLLPGTDRPVIRTYTLSVAPGDGFYRISVKREGAVSRYLHDDIRVGDVIEARAPAGDFTIDAHETRPAVLLAGGVGITPLLAMVRHIVHEGLRTHGIRPTVLFHAARTRAERPFAAELADLVENARAAVKVIRVLTNPVDAAQGVDYDVVGRIDLAMLWRFLRLDDYDFYLCGPPGFTQGLYDDLRALNIADARIHAEAFGPSSLVRCPDPEASSPAPQRPASQQPVAVTFATSARAARWTPQDGTLLDLAEANGLTPEFGCREGACGTCRTKVRRGAVTHIRQPGVSLAADEALICCAVPAVQEPGDTAPLQLEL